MRFYLDNRKRYPDGCPVCGSSDGEMTTEGPGPTNIQARQTCYGCGTLTGTQLLPSDRPLGNLEKAMLDLLVKSDLSIFTKPNPLLAVLMSK